MSTTEIFVTLLASVLLLACPCLMYAASKHLIPGGATMAPSVRRNPQNIVFFPRLLNPRGKLFYRCGMFCLFAWCLTVFGLLISGLFKLAALAPTPSH